MFIQERAPFCPSLACSYAKNEQLFAAMFEILHYLAIVPLVSRDVNVFVTLRVPHSVNLLSHRRFFLAEITNNASDLLIRWPRGQYELATWKFQAKYQFPRRYHEFPPQLVERFDLLQSVMGCTSGNQ